MTICDMHHITMKIGEIFSKRKEYRYWFNEERESSPNDRVND